MQKWFDPHFHLWDLNTPSGAAAGAPSVSGHDAAILFPPDEDPAYPIEKYEKNCDEDADGYQHLGGVYLEALSVCFVDTPGDKVNYMSECKWASQQVAKSERTYAKVMAASLEAPNRAEVLRSLAAAGVCGVRQVLNHQPNWPRSGKLGNLLENKEFVAGFAELAKVKFSFDLQLNPHQFKQAAALVRQHPDVPVIINHLGTPLLKDLQEGAEVYWAGMQALAACPNVYMKISMLCYTDPEWDTNKVVVEAVHKVIALFGASRCMFASNCPVDRKDKWPVSRLLRAFSALAAQYSPQKRDSLFFESAMEAYRHVPKAPTGARK